MFGYPENSEYSEKNGWFFVEKNLLAGIIPNIHFLEKSNEYKKYCTYLELLIFFLN